ncbi:hypothetical protein H9P43_004762 [Blastocladiella emersonii ATCC 22665]|nr:hypothetical protein H9P43_004762 [Blastocladiella emersonii ATCC 22665]
MASNGPSGPSSPVSGTMGGGNNSRRSRGSLSSHGPPPYSPGYSRSSPNAGGGGGSGQTVAKKISLNHLLNFTLPPRQAPPQSAGYSSGPRGAGGSAGGGARKGKAASSSSYESVAHSKERFINANFRFMVSPKAKYSMQMLDPDVFVDWDTVDQVIMTTHDHPACPICLTSPPVAPRMTRCGHVFCYPCILQYHTIEPYEPARRGQPDPTVPVLKQRWRKCPICDCMIYEPELRSVRLWTVAAPLRPLPPSAPVPDGAVDAALRNLAANPPPTFPPAHQHHGEGSGSKRRNHHHRNRANSNRSQDGTTAASSSGQPADDERELLQDPEYARVAAGLPLDTAELVLVHRAPGSVLVAPVHHRYAHTPPDHREDHAMVFAKLVASTPAYMVREVWEPELAEVEREHAATTELAKNLPRAAAESLAQSLVFLALARESLGKLIADAKRAPASSRPPAVAEVGDDDPETVYFYQAANGTHTYLHPLDAKLVARLFSGYASGPARLTVSVVGTQETTVTADLRSRVAALAHVPTGCDVTFLEIDVAALCATFPSFAETAFPDAPAAAMPLRELADRDRARIARARAEARQHRAAAFRAAASHRRRHPDAVIDPASWDPHGHIHNDLEDDPELARVLAMSAAEAGDAPVTASPPRSNNAGASFAAAARESASAQWRVNTSSSSGSAAAAASRSAYALDLGILGAELDALDHHHHHDDDYHHHESDDAFEDPDAGYSFRGDDGGATAVGRASNGSGGANANGGGGGGKKKKNRGKTIALNAGHRRY